MPPHPALPCLPQGEGKGCSGGIHPSRGVGGGGRPRRGGGTPPYGWGYGNAVGFTWHPFPGRRTVGPGMPGPGVRGHPSMVRSVGRGLDPSAGVGGSGSLRGASGTPPLRVAREWAAASLPLIRPCGHLPQGEGKGCCWRRGRRPLRVAREWAAAGACPSSGPAGPPSPKGEGKGCCWRQREPAPYPGSWSSVRSWRVRL